MQILETSNIPSSLKRTETTIWATCNLQPVACNLLETHGNNLHFPDCRMLGFHPHLAYLCAIKKRIKSNFSDVFDIRKEEGTVCQAWLRQEEHRHGLTGIPDRPVHLSN